MDTQERVRAALRARLVQHAEILEDLLGARLHSLGAGPFERVRCLVDQADAKAAPQQVGRKRGADRAGSDDEYVDVT
jgi:hypothetical protein